MGDCVRHDKAANAFTLRVLEGLDDLEELETIIHEFGHAAYWDHDEEFVDEISRDLAALLWALGYRKVET